MLSIAVLAFNVFPPGYCFTRPDRGDAVTGKKQEKQDTDLESDVGMTSREQSV